jgi:hypothetical protein
LKETVSSHWLLVLLIRNPLSYLALLVLVFLTLWGERKLKQSDIVALYTNRFLYHDLLTTPWGAGEDQINKAPGWDMRPLNWHIFVEVRLANDSDTPATLEDADITIISGHKFWFKKRHEGIHIKDLSKCWKHPGHGELTSLMDATRNVPLTKGIGHRGWLRFHLKNCSIRETNSLRYEVALIDALQGRHLVDMKKGSEKDWDKTFEYIFVDP